jgi:hypothetical protein
MLARASASFDLNADEFVHAMRRLSPSPEEAALRAYAPGEVEKLALRYACPQRVGRTSRANALEDLLHRYDVSALEIGRVDFIAGARPHWAGMVVAFFEADPVVTLPGGEVAVFEQARFGERIMGCAASPERFLATLATFVEGLRTGAPWLDNLDAAAARGSARSGGEAYEPFCVALCSVAEYGR